MEALLYIIESRTPFFYRYDNFFLLFYHFSFFQAFFFTEGGRGCPVPILARLGLPSSLCVSSPQVYPRLPILHAAPTREMCGKQYSSHFTLVFRVFCFYFPPASHCMRWKRSVRQRFSCPVSRVAESLIN